MTEQLLQYIWKNQLFNQRDLTTEQGEPLSIQFPGHWNFDQGPDFLLAKITIGTTRLVGNIELHVNASDWLQHQHQHDQQYNNVILHVVLHNNAQVYARSGASIPVLDLSSRISGMLLAQYQTWMQSPETVPCGAAWKDISSLTMQAWKDRLISERLIRKSAAFRAKLPDAYHWDELLWRMLAANLGLKANAGLFEAIAESLPYVLIARNRHDIVLLEAMLMGQAHLLDQQFSDTYPLLLQAQYHFLKAKYQLVSVSAYPVFLRMRPAAFPTIRLAQLAALLHQHPNLFSKLLALQSVQEMQSLFTVQATDYWSTHYRFDETSAYAVKKLGAEMIVNICINTVIPVLFCYGQVMQDAATIEKAMDLLMQLPAEANKEIRFWQQLGVKMQHAADTQAMLELRKQYCNEKRCLDCALGHTILHRSPETN